jgi:uncharacterized cupredoxin-like copper-binding protein
MARFLAVGDPKVEQSIYGCHEIVKGRRSVFLVTDDEQERTESVFVVTNVSDADFTMTCTCFDFQRNAEKMMSLEELEKRKQASAKLAVEKDLVQYGVRMFKVRTPDKNGGHENDVTLAKGGGGELWLCKHVLAVLFSGRLFSGSLLSDVALDVGLDGVKVNGGVLVGWGNLEIRID